MLNASRQVVFTAVLAALVTAAALITVAVLRPRGVGGSRSFDAAGPATGLSAVSGECGDGPCQVLASQNLNGETVQLLADSAGGNGRFEAGGAVLETTVTEMGARLDATSLSCFSASVSACLVSASENGGKVAQLLTVRAGNWRSVGKPYFSAAGVIVLSNVSGGDAAEVVVVETAPVLARVYALDGSVVGCTRRYASLSALRGWPNVRLIPADLRACS